MTMETPIPTNGAPTGQEPAGHAPISTTASRSSSPTVDQLAAMDQLTIRMNEMANDHDGRSRLISAVHDEIAAGGTGLVALGMDPSRMAAEAQHKALVAGTGDAAPAGATPAAEYSALRPEAFADDIERQAFGETMSSAGLDVRVVQSLVADVAGDRYVTEAISNGEAGIEHRLHEVRSFFERNGQMDDLRLAVAFGEHLVAKQPKLAATWDVAMLSENALFTLASEARRLGFTA
jgi:hypothetical protein